MHLRVFIHFIPSVSHKAVGLIDMNDWKTARQSDCQDVARALDESANDALRLVNIYTPALTKGVAPVPLPFLSHMGLRSYHTGVLYSPDFNVRNVSMSNILQRSARKSPSIHETVYANKNDDDGPFLGFDTTEMGVVLYSCHVFDERATSMTDLRELCQRVNGQPLVSLHKTAVHHDDGSTEHFNLYCDNMCAVPVTKDAFNALRCFLGYTTDIQDTPTLTDVQTVLAGLVGIDLSTIEGYRKFCDERRIPFPIPGLRDGSELVGHAEVCRAFSAFYRDHVNVYVACFEGNHRFYTCTTYREGWKVTTSIPLCTVDHEQDYPVVPPDSRLNVNVTTQIAMPLPEDEYKFNWPFVGALRDLSRNTLRASNTVIRPSFKCLMDTLLNSVKSLLDSPTPFQYMDLRRYLRQDYSVNPSKPDAYIKYRMLAIKGAIRTAVRSDPFLEDAFKHFKGDAMTAMTMRKVLFDEFAGNYLDPVALVKNHRPYPPVVRVLAHFLLFVMFTERTMSSLETYMEACSFDAPQDMNNVNIHDVEWIRRYIIESSISVTLGLRDKLVRSQGWNKLRRANSTNFRPGMRKVMLLIHSNFISALMNAVAQFGPSPKIDFKKNRMLSKAVE